MENRARRNVYGGPKAELSIRRTLAVLADNEAGVLSTVARAFSRNGYNIESLAVGTTAESDVSRITVDVMATDTQLELLTNQLRKLLSVHSVKILTPHRSIKRELVLFKIAADPGAMRTNVMQIAEIFRATVIDVSPKTITIAMIGDEDKIHGLVNVLDDYEIMELVRTGTVALERGTETIYEITKERGEFNYGKNVL